MKHLWFLIQAAHSCSLIGLFPLSCAAKTSGVLCVLSRAALPQSCVCMCLSQPACQTALIPSEAQLTSSSPSGLHWFWPGPFSSSNACPPVSLSSDLTGSDSSQAGANYYGRLALAATSSQGALQQIDGLQGGKTSSSLWRLGMIRS